MSSRSCVLLHNPAFPANDSAKKLTARRGIAMKATGIVRRADDLGRIVIPKETGCIISHAFGNKITICPIAVLSRYTFFSQRLFPQQQSQKLAVGEGIGMVGTVQDGVQILRVVFDLLGPQLGIAPKIPCQAPHQQG